MVHGYHILQHWNQWLSQQFLGHALLETEEQQLSHLLKRHYGKHTVLVGVPHQYNLLNATKIPCQTLVSPLSIQSKQHGYIEGDFHELPLLTGSTDLVILPHTLEFMDNPRQLLSEACRIIKPEGLMVIIGFNPYRNWNLRKRNIHSKNHLSWKGNLIYSYKIKQWLQLVDFALEKQEFAFYRPFINHPQLFKKLNFLEPIGHICAPLFGNIYIIIARAKVIPLTPIRLKWKQHLSGIHIPNTISGHTVRESSL